MINETNQLSEREQEILRLVAAGLSNQQIAGQLGISVNTVKVHLRNVFGKIGAASRTEASMYAVRAGIVALDRAGLEDATESTAGESFTSAADDSSVPATDDPERAAVPESRPSAPDHVAADSTTSPDVLIAQHRSMTTADRPYAPSSAAVATPVPAAGRRRWPWAIGALALMVVIATALAWSMSRSAAMTASSAATSVAAPPRWQMLPDLPEPRAAFAAAVFEDRIYAVGGENASGVLDSVLRFDSRSGTWTKLSAKPTAVADVRAVVLGGKLYVPGGRLSADAGDVTAIFERYDLRAEEWETLPDLPEPRSGYALAMLDGKLFVIGGWDGARYRNEVFEYDPERESWQTRTEMPTARAFASTAIVEDRIFVLGGENERGALASNEVYTPSLEGADPWSRRAPLQQPRSRFGAAVALSSIILLGGDPAGAPAKYSVSTDSWDVLEAPPSPLGADPAVVLLDGVVYGLGGRLSDTEYTAQAQGYQAVYTQFLPR